MDQQLSYKLQQHGNTVRIVIAFIALYSWYNAYFHDLQHSPAARAVLTHGADPNLWESLLVFSMLASFVFFLFFVKNQDLPQMRPLWLAIHIGTFLGIQLSVWMPSPALVYWVVVVGGLCLGAVITRVFYSMFLFISGIRPARAVAVAYVFIQTYIHVFTLTPINNRPLPFFIVESATLAVALVFSWLFNGNELEVRRRLPENRVDVLEIGPLLLYITVMQICFTLYDSLMVPQMLSGFWFDLLQVVPNIITLLFFFLFPNYLDISRSLKFFLALIACAVITFLLAANPATQRVAVDLFMQPAFLFFDVFIVSLVAAVFYTYGSKFFRLRLIVGAIVIAFFLSRVLVYNVFGLLPSNFRNAVVIFSFVLLLALFRPMVERFIKAAQAKRIYAESHEEGQVPLPPQCPPVVETRDKILAALPPGVILTSREAEALTYLIDNYDTDVMAYFMELPLSQTNACVKSIQDKCGVSNRHALAAYFRELLAAQGSFEDLDEAAARCKLTPREKEVTRLLLDGLTLRQIGPEMGISFHTVNAYSTSIYRKFGINSRIELFLRFGKQPPREPAPQASNQQQGPP